MWVQFGEVNICKLLALRHLWNLYPKWLGREQVPLILVREMLACMEEFWSSLGHAPGTCMGKGEDWAFPHHLHGQTQVGVYLWLWECPQLNLAPCSAGDGAGMRGSRDSCPVPLSPVTEGSSKHRIWAGCCVSLVSPNSVGDHPAKAEPVPAHIERDPGDFPSENEGLAKSGAGNACLTSRIRTDSRRGFLFLTSSWKWDFDS